LAPRIIPTSATAFTLQRLLPISFRRVPSSPYLSRTLLPSSRHPTSRANLGCGHPASSFDHFEARRHCQRQTKESLLRDSSFFTTSPSLLASSIVTHYYLLSISLLYTSQRADVVELLRFYHTVFPLSSINLFRFSSPHPPSTIIVLPSTSGARQSRANRRRSRPHSPPLGVRPH